MPFVFEDQPAEKERFVFEDGPEKKDRWVIEELPPVGLKASLETLKSIGSVYGPAETAISMGTQIYGVPAVGLAGLAGIPFGKSKEWGEAAEKALIYQPKTKAGQYLTEAISYPFAKWGEVGEAVATKVTEVAGPELGTLAGTAIAAGPAFLGLRPGIKAVKKAFPQLERPIKGDFYQQTVNRHWAIEDITKRAQEKGATIQPGENPGLRARSYLGEDVKVKSILEDKTYRMTPDGKIEITGEGLKPILKEYESTTIEKNPTLRDADLNQYRISKRIVEDLQRPKGDWTHEHIVTLEQVEGARETLNQLGRKYGNLDFLDNTAKRITDYEHRNLHLLVDSGNMSEETYQTIIRNNPNYAPFDRIMDSIEPEGTSNVGMGRRFTDARSPVKRIMGSERPIQNTLESTIKNTYRIMDVAERNTISRNIASLEQWLPEEIKSRAIEVYPIKVSPKEIDTVTRTFRSQAAQILRQTKKTGGVQPPGAPSTSAPMSKLETIVKESLQRRGFTEGEADAALTRIKEAASKRAPGAVVTPGTVETIENTITKIIKETINTIETPIESTIFRPRTWKPRGNIIEYYENGKRRLMEVSDPLYQAMAGMDRSSSGIFMKIASSPARLLRAGVTSSPEFMARNFFRDQLDGFIQSKVGFRPGVDTIGAIANLMNKSDIYYDWLRSGGGHSAFTELSRENLGKMYSALSKDKQWYKKLNVINHARDISEAIESATRLGIYKAGIRKGLSPLEAAFEAREGTVDFGVKGASKELQTWSKLTAFFNPAIQGTDRFIRAHSKNPMETFLKAGATITLPTIALYLRNRKDPSYKEMPRWLRDLFWNFKVGETWTRIPKPFLFGAVYGAAPERFLEYLEQRDPKAIEGMGRTLIDSATPVSGDPASIFLVTGVKPLIENASNWSAFKERQIVPDYKKNWPESEQYSKYTSEAAKLIGTSIGYSPAKVENLIRGYSGYLGQYGMDTIDVALKEIRNAKSKGIPLKGKRPSELADYPMIRAFVSRSPESQSESINQFYRQADEIIGQSQSIRNALQNRDLEGARNLAQKYPKAAKGPELSKWRQSLHNIDKNIDFAIDDATIPEENKRRLIKSLEMQKVGIARKGLEIIGR